MAGPFKMKGSPMQRNFGIGSPLHNDQKELTELVQKRTKLRKKEEKREEKRKSGKKVFLGKIKTKINKKKLEKVQKEINANAKAQENLRVGNLRKDLPGGKVNVDTKTGKGAPKPKTKQQHQNQGRTTRR